VSRVHQLVLDMCVSQGGPFFLSDLTTATLLPNNIVALVVDDLCSWHIVAREIDNVFIVKG